jgi:hypothetical protein
MHDLDNERAIYSRLKQENRYDCIAIMLRNRVAKEIQIIEGKINAESKRETSSKRRYPSRVIHYVLKAVCRSGGNKNRSDRSIPQVLAKPQRQAKEVIE